MFNKEKELVEIGPHSYNLKPGGNGGWEFVHENGLTNKNKTREHYVKMGEKGRVSFQELLKDESYRKQWLIKVHHTQTDETRKRISSTLTGRKRNRVWITNGTENQFYNIDLPIPSGYKQGRVV